MYFSKLCLGTCIEARVVSKFLMQESSSLATQWRGSWSWQPAGIPEYARGPQGLFEGFSFPFRCTIGTHFKRLITAKMSFFHLAFGSPRSAQERRLSLTRNLSTALRGLRNLSVFLRVPNLRRIRLYRQAFSPYPALWFPSLTRSTSGLLHQEPLHSVARMKKLDRTNGRTKGK